VPSYDGAGFARNGVILVSVNYRLGAFGFFAHPALTAEAPASAPLGDYGLEDQIAALKWVKRNIAAFGGDPARVTLAGESAGGEDTLALMTAPAARGLFRQTIVESGLGWGKDDSLADREAQGAALVAKLGLPASAGVADLRALPVDNILAAQGFPWGPTLDRRLILESPAPAFARGVEAPVPLIIGSNSFEASLMALFGGGTDRMLAGASPELKAAYAPENLDPDHLAWALFGDRTMTGPARWIAARHSARAPTFLYHFSYVITAHRAQQPGANHAGEIPFAFDSQEAVPSRAAILTDEDRAATRFMHGCWVSFIKTGAPSCAAGGRVWPAYAPASDELLEFAIQPAVVAHFHKVELDAQEKTNAADLTP
jgi:para-nitrobenzyl esterase